MISHGKQIHPTIDSSATAGVFRRIGPRSAPNRRDALPSGDSETMRAAFICFAAFLDIMAIMAAALVVAEGYHRIVLGKPAPIHLFVHLAALVEVMFVAPNLMRGAYAFHYFITPDNKIPTTLERWTLGFLGALAFVFVTKTAVDISRASAILFYVFGGLAILGTQALMTAAAQKALASGGLFARRIFLVGREEDVSKFLDRYPLSGHGAEVVRAAVLRDAETIHLDLKLAAATARIFRPDDVFILVPWHDIGAIEACIASFACVPASIHMGPERVLERFSDAQISKIGPISSLRVVRRPLGLVEVSLKRLFDLFAAGLSLVALSPLLLMVAIAIKIDSPGPVFFLQRRYGFNQQPFRIVKFRSLTTNEDGAEVRQVTASDTRVTRVGRIIRRTNIDELPQLLNVIMGHMSLVGPRPHAMVHDLMFGHRIALAARRHNVKPGITGWAQVNGYRGEIDSEEKLRGRIEHDLYYIDNWSPSLDLQILLLTIFSRKAYRNAY